MISRIQLQLLVDANLDCSAVELDAFATRIGQPKRDPRQRLLSASALSLRSPAQLLVSLGVGLDQAQLLDGSLRPTHARQRQPQIEANHRVRALRQRRLERTDGSWVVAALEGRGTGLEVLATTND